MESNKPNKIKSLQKETFIPYTGSKKKENKKIFENVDLKNKETQTRKF